MKRITIEPVSRIEGHAKISIQLDDQGHGADLRNLPGQPLAGFSQGLRRDHGRAHSSSRQKIA